MNTRAVSFHVQIEHNHFFCVGHASAEESEVKIVVLVYFQPVRMSTPARKRLMRDFKRLQLDPPAGISGAPQDNNIMLWNAVIFGYDPFFPFSYQNFFTCPSLLLLLTDLHVTSLAYAGQMIHLGMEVFSISGPL